MTFNQLFFLLLLLVFSSCKNTSQVVSHSGFQKRKYQPGWHIEGRRTTQLREEEKAESLAEIVVLDDAKKEDTLSISPSGMGYEECVEADVTPIIPMIKELIALNSQTLSTGEKSYSEADFGQKKKRSKRRKEKFTGQTKFAQSVSVLSYWGYDWPFYKNFIGMTLSGLGIVLSIFALTKLKKNQKRNKRMCYVLIAGNTLILILYLFVF